MLRVTYTGGDAPQRWLFDPDDVDLIEAGQIEDALDLPAGQNTWDAFTAGVLDGKAVCRRALLWHLLRRTNPDYPMPFSEAPNCRMGDLTVELGTAELAKLIGQVEAAPIVKAKKDRHLANLHAEFAVAAQAEEALRPDAVTSDPKDVTNAGSSVEVVTLEPVTELMDRSAASA